MIFFMEAFYITFYLLIVKILKISYDIHVATSNRKEVIKCY